MADVIDKLDKSIREIDDIIKELNQVILQDRIYKEVKQDGKR